MIDEKDIDISRFIPLDMGLQCVEIKHQDKLIIALTKFDGSKEVGVEFFPSEANNKLTENELSALVEKGKQKFDMGY